MASQARGLRQSRAENDVAADAVADGDDRRGAPGTDLGQDRQQVGDVAAQAHHTGGTGSLVPPAVVGHHRQLGQASHHPAEALAAVERTVDQDHRRGPRGRSRSFEDVESGRIAHG